MALRPLPPFEMDTGFPKNRTVVIHSRKKKTPISNRARPCAFMEQQNNRKQLETRQHLSHHMNIRRTEENGALGKAESEHDTHTGGGGLKKV